MTSVGGVITWDEEFRFDVCSEEEELRFHLCDSKKKKTSSKTRVAAAGIYVKDILGYVPVKKRFDMYDPKGGKIVGELGLCFSLDEAEAQLETEGTKRSQEKRFQTSRSRPR